MTKTFDPAIGKTTRWQKGQRSPNPGGRPKSKLLSEALRARLAEVKPDDPEGRTFAEIVAENLVSLASTEGRNSVAAASEVANRVEGRAVQAIDFTDLTAGLRARSEEELRFFLANGRWPESRDQRETKTELLGTE